LIFEDQLTINAPSTEVWECLLDVDRLTRLAPGVQEVKQVDDRTFDAVISAAVGPISGHFSFRAHILESDPPRELTASVDGTDSVTKSKLKADVVMRLAALSPAETQLDYHATVDVQGRLAILGDMVLRATASLMLDEFMRRLRAELEHGPVPS
jgi:uncharacterized protein